MTERGATTDRRAATERRTVIRWIVQTSLNLRYIVVAASVVLMVLGIVALPQMRVDVFPEFAPPRVVIQTACVGLSTSDVEELVTVPLEQGLNGLRGLDDMRSRSVPQLSSIELLFSKDTDLLRARQLVQERLAIVSPTLPTWAAPPVMLRAGLGDRPGHADRHDVHEELADRDVHDRPTGRSGRGCSRCPAWPTSRSGTSGSS